MARSWAAYGGVIRAAPALVLAACGLVGQPDAWSVPAAAEAAGAATVAYDDAPPWDGGAHCSGSFSDGALALSEFLRREFPQIVRVYGYECRPNTADPSSTSQHGTGRAIDLAIATKGGDADNGRGDPVANWLVENSSRVGVQLVIWDRTVWVGDLPAPKARPYSGPDPHVDHIHVELTRAAALKETRFFRDP